MKNRVFVFFLIVVLTTSALAGCQTAQATPEAPPMATVSSAGAAAPAEAAITTEEAQRIALNHAGFTADQVKRLYTDYEIDRGISHYDVEFDQGFWEYDYEIDAQAGEILSFEKDN